MWSKHFHLRHSRFTAQNYFYESHLGKWSSLRLYIDRTVVRALFCCFNLWSCGSGSKKLQELAHNVKQQSLPNAKYFSSVESQKGAITTLLTTRSRLTLYKISGTSALLVLNSYSINAPSGLQLTVCSCQLTFSQ